MLSDLVESEANEAGNAEEETTTIRLPSDWTDLGESFRGTVRYRRMFNRPTGITQDTVIRVCLERVVGVTKVRLNKSIVGEICWPEVSDKFDVAGLLEPRNQLDVEIEALPADANSHSACGLVGEVRLEIG